MDCAEVETGYTDAPCTWDRNYHLGFDNAFVYKPAADAAILALATRLAAIVSYFEGIKDVDSAAPWALGEIRRVIAEHDSDRGT